MDNPLSAILRSGDLVPQTGLYRALHSTPHALLQHEFHLQGTRFRGCRLCPLGVLYRIDNQCVSRFPIRSASLRAMAY
jgi:hypothetical protein